MTKEELKKEAKTECFMLTVNTIGIDQRDVELAYIMGAEPREKRIAELERKLEQTEKELAISEHDREHNDYELTEVHKKVEQIEKENAELKEALAEQKQYNAFKCEDNKKTIDNLKQGNERIKTKYYELQEALKKVRLALIKERTANIMNYGKGGVEMFDDCFEILKGVSN